MNIVLKSMTIGLSLIAGSQAMDEAETNLNDTTLVVLRQTSRYQILDLGSDVSFDPSIGNLRLVCKKWQIAIDKEIDPHKTDNAWIQKKKDFFINSLKSAYKSIGHGEDCEAFLNGKLFYTSDTGEQIVLSIANLKNPFSGEFDLSECGNAGQDLSLRTGHRKEKITENSYKVEIWFTPWFVINKDLSKVCHLTPIFKNWDNALASIGIFWTWGDWDINWMDYLITENFEFICQDNLYEKWCLTQTTRNTISFNFDDIGISSRREHQERFHVSFNMN